MSEMSENTLKQGDLPGIESRSYDAGLESYTLANGNGMSVTIINYGAAIAKIVVPDRGGVLADIVLGHDDPKGYIGGRFYLGATVGRFANRIAAGHFVLRGKEYHVTKNRNGNLLHGGNLGFDKKFWKTRIVQAGENPAIELKLLSPDGDEGFPGNLDAAILYTVTQDDELRIDYTAVTDKTTVINLTNHGYFNLTGSAENSILDHVLTINADTFIPTDDAGLPTGEMRDVSGTPMDFRKLTAVGDRIGVDYDQLKNSEGYDKNFVLNGYDGEVHEAAVLYEPVSGRVMEVLTDQPGLQFYSGNYLDGAMEGKNGVYYRERTGLCLECQHFPDSPNRQNFPSTTLEPGDVYRQTTIFRFSVDTDQN